MEKSLSLETDIQTIAVLGAGHMGSGIAQTCLVAGYPVLLLDREESALSQGREAIESSLTRLVKRGTLTADDKDKALSLLTTSTDLALLKPIDLLIEAVTENEAVKVAAYKSIVPHLGAHTLLASNTSSISITRLASVTDRPEKFIGIHFMNPAPFMRLVELIRGIATSPATFSTARGVVERLGKTVVESDDFPAFIVNRILFPMVNEAIYTLYEGVGTVESIDTALKLGANHPMGPLELADFIGLDICLSIMQTLNRDLSDAKYRPCPLLIKYVEAGWLGRKTGRGFYDYGSGTPVPSR